MIYSENMSVLKTAIYNIASIYLLKLLWNALLVMTILLFCMSNQILLMSMLRNGTLWHQKQRAPRGMKRPSELFSGCTWYAMPSWTKHAVHQNHDSFSDGPVFIPRWMPPSRISMLFPLQGPERYKDGLHKNCLESSTINPFRWAGSNQINDQDQAPKEMLNSTLYQM